MNGNIKEVERIYYNFDKLCDDYTDFPEVKEASKAFWEYIYMNNLIGNTGSRHKLPLDELIGRIANTSEKQGFIYGFNYAVELLKGGAV